MALYTNFWIKVIKDHINLLPFNENSHLDLDISEISEIGNRESGYNGYLRYQDGDVTNNTNSQVFRDLKEVILSQVLDNTIAKGYLEFRIKNLQLTVEYKALSTHVKEYFDIEGLKHIYPKELGNIYKTAASSTKIYNDTKRKLQYLGKELSKVININTKNNYNEKPNRQAGQGKGFTIRPYILTGFAPSDLQVGKEIFVKLSFRGFDSELEFGLDVDVNFKNQNNPFKEDRPILQKQYWSIPVDSDFPDNWLDLIKLTAPVFKTQMDYLVRYINSNNEMKIISDYKNWLTLHWNPNLADDTINNYGNSFEDLIEISNCENSKLNNYDPDVIRQFYDYLVNLTQSPFGKGSIMKFIELQLGESKIKQHQDYPLNQILFGPPGTGKTYATMAKAVGIIEGLTEPELHESYPSRKDLKDKYQEYIDSGQIVFTTFHQSFTYEDFVEGIKPNLSEKDVSYTIESGVFKSISEDALENFQLSKLNNSQKERLPFKTAFELFKKELEEALLEDEKGLNVNLQSSHFYIYDIVGDSLKMETSTGGRKNTMTSPTLEKIYEVNQPDHGILTGGMKGYYNALVNKLNTYSENREIKSAQKSPLKNFVLIIDEINRGNISQIFGELITLLEKDKRLGNAESLSVKLPYSKKPFGVPPNLYVIGTMNTADRSVEALDTALRRRFAFQEVAPRTELLKEGEFEGLDLEIELHKLLQTINERIELLIDKDHMIGHSYFFSLIGAEDCEAELKSIFYDKIIPLLEEYFYGDFGKIGLVLGEAFVHTDSGKDIKFAPFKMDDQSIFQEKSIYTIKDYRSKDYDVDFLTAVKRIYVETTPDQQTP